MKKTLPVLLKSLCLGLIISCANTSFGQCPIGSYYASANVSTTIGQPVTISTCNYLGEFSTVNNFAVGSSY